MQHYSFLDTDYYKFTQGQFVFNQFPNMKTKHVFFNRSKNIDLRPYKQEIEEAILQFCDTTITPDELSFLKSQKIFKTNYLEFLKLLKLNPIFLKIWNDDTLHIEIEGPFFITIYFEKILSIISEVYSKKTLLYPDFKDAYKTLDKKIKILNDKPYGVRFADFGTRRRYSYAWHRKVIEYFHTKLNNHQMIGTSNVLFAKDYNIRPIGTQAHEIYMMGQQSSVKLADSQKHILQKWVDEYRGDLGIALTDTINLNAFLKDFDNYFAKLYDGVRHDSGDPFLFGRKIIEHYQKLGIDPRTKTIVFSDGLNFDLVMKLFEEFSDQIKVSFGIGTNLTHDFSDIGPLSIVIKMQQCNGQPVAKISDSPGKIMCQDEQYLNYLKRVFEVTAD